MFGETNSEIALRKAHIVVVSLAESNGHAEGVGCSEHVGWCVLGPW